MKAVEILRPGGSLLLQLRARATPVAGAGVVLPRVQAGGKVDDFPLADAVGDHRGQIGARINARRMQTGDNLGLGRLRCHAHRGPFEGDRLIADIIP